MSNERRTGGRKSRSERSHGSIPQLPWRDLVNAAKPFELATPDQLDAIHATSMRILSELGIRVMGETVRDLLERAGAIVDRSEGIVRIDKSIVVEALKTAPQSFSLTSRNPAKRLTIGR